MNENTRKINVKHILIQYNTYIILLLLFIACSLLSDNFLSVMNIKNILLQQAAPIFVSAGMLFVILTGGIDLSVGSIMALGASITAVLIGQFHMNMFLAIILSIGFCLLVGSITGGLVAFTNMQGFVASLAIMTMARGLAFMITNGSPIKVPQGTLDSLVSGKFMYPIILITVIMVALLWFVQKYTSYGRIVIAIGSNKVAVELAGVNAKKYIVSVYAVSAVLAAIAGIFLASRTSTGSATIGMGQELDAIAACVIGGASLSGGKGFVIRTVAGALVLALIGNIMNLMSVPSYPQDIIKGFIIIAAVLLQLFTGKNEKTI